MPKHGNAVPYGRRHVCGGMSRGLLRAELDIGMREMRIDVHHLHRQACVLLLPRWGDVIRVGDVLRRLREPRILAADDPAVQDVRSELRGLRAQCDKLHFLRGT